MMFMWYASIIAGYDRRRSRLSDAPLHINIRYQQNTLIAISPNSNDALKDALNLHQSYPIYLLLLAHLIIANRPVHQ